MKKVYLLMPVLAFGTAFGQLDLNGPAVNAKAKPTGIDFANRSAVTSGSRVPGDVVYSEDWDGGLNGWTVTGEGGIIDQTGAPGQAANTIAVWTDVGCQGDIVGGRTLNSPTAANGHLIMDLDFMNGAGGPANPATIQRVHAEFVSPTVDLSDPALSDISVRFYQDHARCCWSGGSVPTAFNLEVSLDGFASIAATYDLTYADAPVNVASGARLYNVNISNAINPGTAGAANVQFRFRCGVQGDQYNPTFYYWMIDDFEVYETDLLRAEIDTLNWSVDQDNAVWQPFGGFQQIPTYAAQTTNLDWTAWMFNEGVQSWTGAKLHVDMDGSTFAESTPENIAAGANSAALHVATGLLNTTTGVHNFLVYPVADQVMAIADTLGFNIELTEDVNNAGTIPVAQTGLYSGAGNVENGNVAVKDVTFQTITQDYGGFGGNFLATYNSGSFVEQAYGISVVFEDDPVNENFIPAKVVLVIDGVEVLNEPFTVDDAILGTPQFIPFSSPVTISAGQDVLYLVEDFDGELRFHTDGSEAYHVGIQRFYDVQGDEYIFYDEVAMVRLHTSTNETVSLEEEAEEASINNMLHQNVPNPFDNNTIVRFDLNETSDCIFQVTDITGKVVKTMDLGTRGAGQHQVELNSNDFNKGVYFYTLSAGENTMTKKMIVTK